MTAEGHTIKVTVSTGVSEISADDRIAKLIRRSDEALYSAKMSGRNRVFVHTESSARFMAIRGRLSSPAANANASSSTNEGTAEAAKDSLQVQLLNRLDELLAEEQRK